MKTVRCDNANDKPEVHCGSDHQFHADLYKTLVLTMIDAKDYGPVYFVMEGLATNDKPSPYEHAKYYLEEHTCPTNWVGGEVVCIANDGDMDPHGVFKVVRAVWMPQAYVDAKKAQEESRISPGTHDEIMAQIFPELVAPNMKR